MEEDGIEVCEGGQEGSVSGDITVSYWAVTGQEWIISETKPSNKQLRAGAGVTTGGRYWILLV